MPRAGSCWCVYHLLLAKIDKFWKFWRHNIPRKDKKDPLHPLPSVHVAEERVLSSPVPRPQLVSDASRLIRSFGGRPSDIPNFLGLDNPAVTGCQVGSILETPPNCVCQVWYERWVWSSGAHTDCSFFAFSVWEIIELARLIHRKLRHLR